jgi:DsrE/DsrF-like family
LPGTFRIRGGTWGSFAAILLASVLPFQQQTDRLGLARSRFEKETDPVHKAKLIVPLGTAEFDQIEKQVADSDLIPALDELHAYQSQVTLCEKALDARGVDPEKHSAGFKELEISVRESLRRLDNVLVRLSGDDQKPFLEVRKSLDEINRHLIRQLFPLQPGVTPDSAKPRT